LEVVGLTHPVSAADVTPGSESPTVKSKKTETSAKIRNRIPVSMNSPPDPLSVSFPQCIPGSGLMTILFRIHIENPNIKKTMIFFLTEVKAGIFPNGLLRVFHPVA
jgi:hypothetical protein